MKLKLRYRFIFAAAVIVLAEVYSLLTPMFTNQSYALGSASGLLPESSPEMASFVSLDSTNQEFNFKPASSTATSDLIGQPTYSSASLYVDPSKGVTTTDPVNKVDFTITPKFNIQDGRQDQDRIVYPLSSGDGWVVYTLRGDGVKEDILLDHSPGDSASFSYSLGLGSNMVAKLETDGSVGIYGNTLLSGDIATGTASDAALLQKARQNAPKDTLLFDIPAPVVTDKHGPANGISAKYSLRGNTLTLTTTGLKKGQYPLAIDPSVFVVTAAQFMAGNNETNIDFDVDNKLIKKASTTGARFDQWNSTSGLPGPVWGSETTPAGGYIYSVGGTSYSGQTYTSQGASTYVVPIGVTSITVEMWGGGGGGGAGDTAAGGAGGGAGYVDSTLTVTPGETLTVYVGGSGGAGVRNTTGGGGGGGGYSSLYRGATALAVAAGGAGGGGGLTSSARTGGAGGPGGCTTTASTCTGGTAGGTTPLPTGGVGATTSGGGAAGTLGNNVGSAGTSLNGGEGGDGRTGSGADGSAANGGLATGGDGGSAAVTSRAGGGGGGSGYFGGGGGSGSTSSTGGSGGGGGSSYTANSCTSGDTCTAGSGVNPGNSGSSIRNGAGAGGTAGPVNGNGSAGSNGLVSITYGGGGSTTSSAVNWAQFDTSTGTIDSPNPGNGACTGWCSTAAYNLPDGRANFSMVAYNGFLYAIGGTSSNCTTGNGTGTSGYCKTVYIARLGANGEPRLWSPTSSDTSTWTYWYRDTDLPSERAFAGAVAYNNHMYFMGGRTSSSATNVVYIASITPTGQLGAWTSSGNTLPTSNQYDFSAQQYNGRIYAIGGSSGPTSAPSNSVWYTKINANGTINAWQQTTSFTTGRISGGSNLSVVWGAYIYISGGCSAVNASGYCTSIASDAQVASINADGSLDTWNTMAGVTDARMGYSLIAWRNNIYEVGGCSAQNTSTGDCNSGMLSTINYGSVNQDGDASTVGQSVPSGTAPCSGGTPYNCDLPAVGTGAGQIGQMLAPTAIMGGYLYVIGGCTNVGTNTCTTTSDNTAYVAISSTGTLTEPTNCVADGNTLSGSWCVDSTHGVSGGIAAGGTAIFDGRIYLMGGLTGAATKSSIYYIDPNADGSLDTAGWQTQTFASIGLGAGTGGYTTVAYDYAYARANPSQASTLPGNIYVFGGCTTTSGGDGCTAYTGNVYKCSITTSGSIDVTGTGHSPCTVTSQLQIGSYPGDSGGSGLGIMSGTVYANYIYLIGGVTSDLVDLTTVIYAKFDNNNNIVAASGSAWTKSAVQTSVGRRRGSAFGYNGYLYVVGGFDATAGVLADIEFAKINVSDGSLVDQSGGSNLFNVSSVQIGARWGLSVPVSNSYAYVIGGCDNGTSPSCSTGGLDATIQTFQLYNNDSGAPAGYTTSANTYTTNANRTGVAGVVYNGYLYAAGGCTGTTDCMNPVSTVSYAPIDTQGAIGTWSNTTGSLPASVAWGKLLVAGNSLYYVGGQDSNGIAQSTVYYGTPSAGNVSSWSTATNGLPAARTRFGAAVWNNRLYVVGGASGTQNTVIYNTAGTGTFVVPTGVTSLTVKAWGAGGGGGNGSGSTGSGGGGGGGGFSQATLTVTPGASLTYNVGTGGGHNTTASYAGNGGGFSALLNGATYLIQAGGGGGGGGTTSTAGGGNGGGGGGSSGIAGVAATGTATVGGLGGFGTTTAGGAAGAAGTTGVAGIIGAANLGGDGGGSLTSCTTTVTGRGGNGGTGAGGKGGTSATCVNGGGAGGGRFGGGGGGSATNAAARGGGAGGGGSDLVTGATTTETAGSAAAAGVGGAAANNGDVAYTTAGTGGNGSTSTASTSGNDGEIAITYGTYTPQATVYVSPIQSNGGNITTAWSTSSTSFSIARVGPMVVAYANNLYVFGGHDGTNYLSDSQYSQLDGTTGNAGAWTYSESMPQPLAGGDAFAANGYIYLVGGRSADTVCAPTTLVAPVSANTAILANGSGNTPTGIGAWYQTNQGFTGARYGNAAVYNDGKAYVMGGGCGTVTTYASPVTQQAAILSQPQVADYSIMLDTDSDVYPTNWLLNGVDNSIGARWQLSYQSMTDPTKNGPNGLGKNCSAAAMTTWGQTTNFGDVTLKLPGVYTALDGSGANTNCARYYFLNISVSAQNAFGYPDDVTRGPTITDLTLAFTADPAKRLMHGRTFVGGLQQPDDTPYYSN